MKKKDIVIITFLCVIIGIGYLVFTLFQKDKGDIEVYYKNEVIDRVDISKDGTYTYEGSYGTFHLEVKDHRYHATQVECPNHDCEKVGWVDEGSSTAIVCVPNEIYVLQANAEDKY